MIKISVASHMQDTDDELKVNAEYRFEKMNNIVVFSRFQPDVTLLGQLLSTFKSTSNTAKEIGGSPAIKAKNKAKDALKQHLKLLNTDIEVAANKLGSDEAATAFAEETGADVQNLKNKKAAKKTVDFLEMPANFFVENDRLHKAAALATWEASKGAVTYIIKEVDDAGKVLNTYNTTETFLLIQGTESEVKKTYILNAVGKGTLASEDTEPFPVWVR